MADRAFVLRAAYHAFNTRDVDAAVELMHPNVDWPNAWKAVGQPAARRLATNWKRQFAAITSKGEPERFTEEPDGSITVDVHQVVRDARTGGLLADAYVRHRYCFDAGPISRMDVLEPPDRQ